MINSIERIEISTKDTFIRCSIQWEYFRVILLIKYSPHFCMQNIISLRIFYIIRDTSLCEKFQKWNFEIKTAGMSIVSIVNHSVLHLCNTIICTTIVRFCEIILFFVPWLNFRHSEFVSRLRLHYSVFKSVLGFPYKYGLAIAVASRWS